MIQAKFYDLKPFLTPTLFKISTVKSCQVYHYQVYFFCYTCPQANQFLFSDNSPEIITPLTRSLGYFCVKQMHHGKVFIQELNEQSQ